MATRGWLPSRLECYLLEVGTVCLHLVLHHTRQNTKSKLHVYLWFDIREENQHDLMTDPVCGQSRQREQSFIYSLIQFENLIKLVQGLGVAAEKNYNDEWDRAAALKRMTMLKGESHDGLWEKMGKQKESSSSHRGMVGGLCVGGKGRQTDQWDTGREPAMSWKSLVYESTPRGRNQWLNLLTWDCPYYIAKWKKKKACILKLNISPLYNSLQLMKYFHIDYLIASHDPLRQLGPR